jgi:hypothetical protein
MTIIKKKDFLILQISRSLTASVSHLAEVDEILSATLMPASQKAKYKRLWLRI